MGWNSKSIGKRFMKGQVPWNKGTKGICKATAGSFRKGQQILKGRQNPFFGKHHTEESKKKISRKGDQNPNWKGGKVKRFCQICENVLYVDPNVVKNDHGKFCSRKCEGKWRSEILSGSKSHFWKGGISKVGYPFNFNEELKELIRKRDNYQCQLCGMPEIEEMRKLSIHHVDYDKENNDPKNLVTLCRRCNSKLNFNREYWENYFVMNRRNTDGR